MTTGEVNTLARINDVMVPDWIIVALLSLRQDSDETVQGVITRVLVDRLSPVTAAV